MFFKKRHKNKQENQNNVVSNTRSIITEQYKAIRTNIEYSAADRELKLILVTSAIPGDGKSVTSSNLAVVFSQQGKKVLLIDADMRKPTIHKNFGLENNAGITSILSRKATVEEVINDTSIDNLSILTCGPLPPNPTELLTSKALENLLNKVYEEYDVIILDTPPVLAVADAQILSKYADGVILVVSSGRTEKEKVKKAKHILESSNANLIGVVLNNKKQEKADTYYYYYGEKDMAN